METTTISHYRTACGTCLGSGVFSTADWAGPRSDVCDGCLGVGTVLTHAGRAAFAEAREAGMTWEEASNLVR